MSNEHAMRFPLVGSAMLLSLFLLFKFVSKDLVNAVLTCYFFVLGIVALSYVPSVWVILLCLILVADWWFGVILHYLLIFCPFHTLQSNTFTCNQTFSAKAVERGPYNLAFSVFSLYVVPPFSLPCWVFNVKCHFSFYTFQDAKLSWMTFFPVQRG